MGEGVCILVLLERQWGKEWQLRICKPVPKGKPFRQIYYNSSPDKGWVFPLPTSSLQLIPIFSLLPNRETCGVTNFKPLGPEWRSLEPLNIGNRHMLKIKIHG